MRKSRHFLCWAACAALAHHAHAQHSLSAKWISYVGAEYEPDAVYAIAADSHTNAYFAGQLAHGWLVNADDVPTDDPTGWQGDGFGDGFAAKAAADGTLLWSTCLTYGNGSVINGIAHAGNAVFAAGAFGYNDPWAWVEEWDTDTRTNATLVKLDDATGALIWDRELGGAADNFCTFNGYTAVAADPAGNIYAAGYTTITNIPTSLVDSHHGGGRDAVVVKHAPDGTILWVRYLGGANDDSAAAIALGADGAIYVAGQTRSPGWVTLGNPAITGPACGFLAKLAGDGTVLYSTLLGGTSIDSIAAILCDAAAGTLILAGHTASADFCSGLASNTRNGTADGFVMSLTDLGASCHTNWFRFVGGNTAQDAVTALAWMDNGQIIAGGFTDTGGWLDTQGEAAIAHQGQMDGFLLQLDKASGQPRWATYVGGAANDALYAIAVADEAVFAGGTTLSPGFAYDGFWDTWDKHDGSRYGFIGKWTQGPGEPPAITADMQDVIAHEGDNATFTLTVQATPSPTYYWTTNNIPVFNPAAHYTLPAVTPAADGTLACCVASNIFGCATSRVARLTVIPDGTLTATLAPPQAIAQGAQWSIDGGAAWHSSGATLTLRPDAYTVTFASIAGWTTPTNQTASVAPAGAAACTAAYAPILATASRAISGTNATLTVQMPDGATGWTLTETLPSGVTPTDYAPGVWDSGARTLTFSGATPATLTYTVTAASGLYPVSGSVTTAPSGMPAAVTGDTQLIHANLLRVINGTQVTIHVIQPPSNYSMIMETLSSGLDVVPESVSAGGMSPANNLVMWLSPATQTLSYEVTGTPGAYSLSGQGSLSIGGFDTIFGDTVVTIANPPAVAPNILRFSVHVHKETGTLAFTSAVNQAYMVQTNATLAPLGWHDYLPITATRPVTSPKALAPPPQPLSRIPTPSLKDD
ncbi:MAG: hypothetical protein FWG50_12525, partial [Kiritimatiellaeota bacterium]|nr:hypothetical protein [Kiritimatiellota bacterium]